MRTINVSEAECSNWNIRTIATESGQLLDILTQCSTWNITAALNHSFCPPTTTIRSHVRAHVGIPLECSNWNIRTNVPSGTLVHNVLRVTFCGKITANIYASRIVSTRWRFQYAAPKYVIAIAHCLALFCERLSDLQNLNGTRHRGSQPEGRRGKDYDCHQSGLVVCGRRSQHLARRLRSAVKCHQRPGPGQGSGTNQHLPSAH